MSSYVMSFQLIYSTIRMIKYQMKHSKQYTLLKTAHVFDSKSIIGTETTHIYDEPDTPNQVHMIIIIKTYSF